MVGISGELQVDRKSGDKQTKLRNANSQLVLLLEKETGAAKDSAEAAAGASERADRLAHDASGLAGKAKDKADSATTIAASAQNSANAVGTKAADLGKNLDDTEAQLKVVEDRRAKLEEALVNLAVCNAPRTINIWDVEGAGRYSDPLKTIAGISFFVEVVPDAEAKRAASNIEKALLDAGERYFQQRSLTTFPTGSV